MTGLLQETRVMIENLGIALEKKGDLSCPWLELVALRTIGYNVGERGWKINGIMDGNCPGAGGKGCDSNGFELFFFPGSLRVLITGREAGDPCLYENSEATLDIS